MHPHQDPGGADQGQGGHQEPAQGFPDKLVHRVQVGDQVCGHGATAQAFVFTQGDTLEPLDQPHADAVDNVLGQPRKQAGLDHVEHQRRAAQYQGDQQHQADIPGSLLPGRRQRVVHHLQRSIAIAQQHFVHQQRQEQGNRYAAQGRQYGDTVGNPQGFFMAQGQATDFCPGQPINPWCWLIMHRQLAPASDRAAATARTAAGSHWSTTPTGHCVRPARSGNRRCPGPGPK